MCANMPVWVKITYSMLKQYDRFNLLHESFGTADLTIWPTSQSREP